MPVFGARRRFHLTRCWWQRLNVLQLPFTKRFLTDVYGSGAHVLGQSSSLTKLSVRLIVSETIEKQGLLFTAAASYFVGGVFLSFGLLCCPTLLEHTRCFFVAKICVGRFHEVDAEPPRKSKCDADAVRSNRAKGGSSCFQVNREL